MATRERGGFVQIPTYLTTQIDRRLSIEMKQLLFNLAPTSYLHPRYQRICRQILQTRDLKILQ